MVLKRDFRWEHHWVVQRARHSVGPKALHWEHYSVPQRADQMVVLMVPRMGHRKALKRDFRREHHWVVQRARHSAGLKALH
jgi:hypothetical protein